MDRLQLYTDRLRGLRSVKPTDRGLYGPLQHVNIGQTSSKYGSYIFRSFSYQHHVIYLNCRLF